MLTPLSHLIDSPEYDALEPQVERGDPQSMLRSPRDARDELKAKAQTAAVLLNAGMEIAISDDEETEAMQQFQREVQQLPITPSSKPAVVLKLTALLSEYDHEIVHEAAQMRKYVTNRLLEESGPTAPATQRLQALKLLGQITEVGLFTERTEITVNQLPTKQLEEKLYAKLRLLLPTEVEVIDSTAARPESEDE